MQQYDSPSSQWDATICNDLDAMRLVESLGGNTQVNKLIVSFEEDAVVSNETSLTLATALANVAITSLTLIWQEFQAELHSSLARLLMQAVQKSSTILNLDLHSMVGEIDSLVVAASRLRSLGLYDDWDPKDIHQLGDSLHRMPSLTSLTFHGVNLDSTEALGLLSRGIARNPTIKDVAFRACGISDEGVKAFHEHWHEDSQIQTLEWTTNVIQAEGALLLVEAASNHTSLENLHIMGNEIGYDAVANVALMLPDIRLKRLTLSSCVSDTLALDPAFKEHRRVVGGLILEGAKSNRRLVKLDVNGSGILIDSPGMAEEIDFYTGRNEYEPLIQLVPSTVWCHIFANFGDDVSLTYYLLREQPLLWPENQSTRSSKKQRRQS